MSPHAIPLLGAPIERRHLLAAALALPFPRLARGRASGTTWEQFLERAPVELAELARATTAAEQDAYLFALASLVARVERVPGGKLERFAELTPEVLFGMLHFGTPFFVVEWRLTPGAVLPVHCHPGASVCTLALEGEAEIRHYELEPDAPAFDSGSDAPFLLRETRRQRLRAGSVSTLSATRDNLHGFRAGAAGARGIDLSTMHGGDGRFSFARLDPDAPTDVEGRVEARWTGQTPP
jgi:hypothetical protein